jgi:hypothetical protein
VRRFIELLRGHAHDTDSSFADAAEPDAEHVAAHA